MRLSRLRGRKVCEKVQKDGHLWKGRHMLVRWLPGYPRHPSVDPATPALYLGTLASTRLHKTAVKRNRMRRRCKEAWRLTVREAPEIASVQLLVIPRSSSLEAPFADLRQDVARFLTLFHARR